MSLVYDTGAAKKATNISINSDLIKKAKAHKINLSQSMEIALEKIIREKEVEAWQKNNKEAIASYNERVKQRGVFSDSFRRF